MIKKPISCVLPQSPDNPDRRVLREVAKFLNELNIGRQGRRVQGMIIAQDRNHATDLAEKWSLLDLPGTCAVYHGQLANDIRRQAKHEFTSGNTDVLIVVQMLREGFDHPPVTVIGFCRRVGSPVLFGQFVGRALRIVRDDDTFPTTATVVWASEHNLERNWNDFISEKLIPVHDDPELMDEDAQ